MGRVGSTIVLPGQRFGRRVTQRFHSKGTLPETLKVGKWECTCDCGVICYVRTADLIGGVGMCKLCSNRANTRYTILPDQGAVWNKILLQIKRGASERGILMLLPDDDIRKLVMQECFYCGDRSSNRSTSTRGDYIECNGIDRVDNARGYTKDNCVPCCSRCNTIKMHYPINELLERLERILSNKSKILERSETISRESTDQVVRKRKAPKRVKT